MDNKIPKSSRLNDWPTQESFKQEVNENFEKEAGYLSLRFDDLSKQGQKKLCKLLKKDSPIWTVRKPEDTGGLTKREILHSLRVANPIIFNNWNKGFRYGQLPRGKATEISRVAFYMCRRKPTEETVEKIEKLVATKETFPYQMERYDIAQRIAEVTPRDITPDQARQTILRARSLSGRAIGQILTMQQSPQGFNIVPSEFISDFKLNDDDNDDDNINIETLDTAIEDALNDDVEENAQAESDTELVDNAIGSMLYGVDNDDDETFDD